MRKTVNFGLIGCGLMGRAFADAAGRWEGLEADIPKPVIRGVCDPSETARAWFEPLAPQYSTADYRELLAAPDIEAVYCAVPHQLHAQLYSDIIRAGKHLMAEKPFGIDQAACEAILAVLAQHPGVFVRCSSEFPFYPGCSLLASWLREGRFGRIIEVRAGFCHSSDMDLDKPINWKRVAATNGAYGCLGDLGLHTQHLPLRMGLLPRSVYASLANLVHSRPDGKGGAAVCDTWDNATLVCEARGPQGEDFPMILTTKRMAPGATNLWSLEIDGLEGSARFSTDDAGAFYYTQKWGREQAWCRVNVGYKPQFKTAVGPIFEFGFADSILQMWAAFMAEMDGRAVALGCATPQEARFSHAINTAALLSHSRRRAVDIEEVRTW